MDALLLLLDLQTIVYYIQTIALKLSKLHRKRELLYLFSFIFIGGPSITWARSKIGDTSNLAS